MINTIILIIVLGGASSQSGYTSVNVEFQTFEHCEIARKFIVSDANSKRIQVESHGCFSK